MSADDVLSSALSLPASDRARLVHELLASLDGPGDPDAGEAWLAEIERRAGEVRSGTASLERWQDIRNRLLKRWQRR